MHRCYKITNKLCHLLPGAMKITQDYLSQDVPGSAKDLFKDAATCRSVVDKELDKLDQDGVSFRDKVMNIIQEPDVGDRLAQGSGLFSLFEKRPPRKS